MRPRGLPLALAVGAALPAQAQPNAAGQAAPVYDVGGFGTVMLTTGGFALGGGTRAVLGERLRLVLDASVGGVADERETRFSGPEGAAIPSKYEYLLLVPLRAGVERRLFAAEIEDNVRPFLRLGAGPTVGVVHPYFGDCNGNRTYDRSADCNGDGTAAPGEGEEVLPYLRSLGRARAAFGVGATLALGAHVGRSRRGLQSVTVAYRVDYLPAGVQLLEPAVRARRYWFATPDVSISLRLL